MINYLPLPCISHSVLSHLHLSSKATTNTSQYKSSSVLIHNPEIYVKVNHLPSQTLLAPFQASSILTWGWVFYQLNLQTGTDFGNNPFVF